MILRFIGSIALIQAVLVHSLCAQPPENDAKYEQFVHDFAEKIKEKKPVPPQVFNKLRSVFISKARANIYNDWATSIKESLQLVWPDTAVFSLIYHTTIRKEAVRLTAIERMNLIRVHHVSKDGYASISRMLERRGYQEALLEFTYAAYPRTRDSLLRIVSQQADSLIEIALLKEGSMLCNNQFAIALKYKKTLGLSPVLTDSLLRHALCLSKKEDTIRLKDPFAPINFDAYEASVLNKLLSEEQYTKLLSIKNKSKAQQDANEDWEEISQRGMVSAFDEEKVKTQLFNYHLAKLNTYYRNANNLIKRKGSLLALQENLPKVIRDLYVVRNRPLPGNASSTQPKW